MFNTFSLLTIRDKKGHTARVLKHELNAFPMVKTCSCFLLTVLCENTLVGPKSAWFSGQKFQQVMLKANLRGKKLDYPISSIVLHIVNSNRSFSGYVSVLINQKIFCTFRPWSLLLAAKELFLYQISLLVDCVTIEHFLVPVSITTNTRTDQNQLTRWDPTKPTIARLETWVRSVIMLKQLH